MSYKDTIQNFQFCSVWAWTYSLNFCLMWSKRCCVMGTPVAGSCSWHALQSETDETTGWKRCVVKPIKQNRHICNKHTNILIKINIISLVFQHFFLHKWVVVFMKLMSFTWVKQRLRTHLMAEFRSWISSRSFWVSSCSWALSCCILLMYSAVFSSVVALLICASRQGDYNMSVALHMSDVHISISQLCSHLSSSSCLTAVNCTFMLGWELSVVTRLCKVSKPILMLKRRFCSADIWVILLVSVCCR